MTQPRFSPIAVEDEVRPSYRLGIPTAWHSGRPADPPSGRRAEVRGGGVPGPDQGYALLLARRFAGRLVTRPGEHADDVLAGAVAIGLRRSSAYGRAPVAHDVELALELFCYLGDAPDDLAGARRARFAGVAHDYVALRALAASVPDATLRLSPATVREMRTRWRELAGDEPDL